MVSAWIIYTVSMIFHGHDDSKYFAMLLGAAQPDFYSQCCRCYHEDVLSGPWYKSIIYSATKQESKTFFISEFEPILTHKIKSIIDESLKFGTNLLQHKLYIKFKLWDVTMITSIFMAS